MYNLRLYEPRGGWLERGTLWSQLFGPSAFGLFEDEKGLLKPRVDISENETAYTVKADMPGFNKEEVRIEVENGRLRLEAEHKEEREENKESYHLKERRYGTITRTFILPEDVDPEKIEATMENGVLKLNLPKTEKTRPKQIEVQVH